MKITVAFVAVALVGVVLVQAAPTPVSIPQERSLDVLAATAMSVQLDERDEIKLETRTNLVDAAALGVKVTENVGDAAKIATHGDAEATQLDNVGHLHRHASEPFQALQGLDAKSAEELALSKKRKGKEVLLEDPELLDQKRRRRNSKMWDKKFEESQMFEAARKLANRRSWDAREAEKDAFNALLDTPEDDLEAHTAAVVKYNAAKKAVKDAEDELLMIDTIENKRIRDRSASLAYEDFNSP